jgi:cobalt-zinc-cadmium efflux system protein
MAAHAHGPTSGRLLWISLALTVLFVALEFFFGLRSHSLALISDSGHKASDGLALGLAAYAVWVGKRPASHGKTFGYHRVAILIALVNALALGGIAVAILVEAWFVFRHPMPVDSVPMIFVAAVAVAMNTLLAYWLHADSRRSLNVRAVYIHMAGDAMSAFGVVLAGLLIHFTGWRLADPLVSVLIAVFILYSAWGIIVDATNILLEGTPKDLDVAALVTGMKEIPSVLDVHDLHVWTVGDGLNFLSCHVVLPDLFTVADQTRVIRAINERLHNEFGIAHATIQTEIDDCDGCHIAPEELYCALEPHGHTHSHAGAS